MTKTPQSTEYNKLGQTGRKLRKSKVFENYTKLTSFLCGKEENGVNKSSVIFPFTKISKLYYFREKRLEKFLFFCPSWLLLYFSGVKFMSVFIFIFKAWLTISFTFIVFKLSLFPSFFFDPSFMLTIFAPLTFFSISVVLNYALVQLILKSHLALCPVLIFVSVFNSLLSFFFEFSLVDRFNLCVWFYLIIFCSYFCFIFILFFCVPLMLQK